MFRWYRPHVQLVAWKATVTSWMSFHSWELAGYRDFMDFAVACLPEGASFDREGEVVGADGEKIPGASAGALFRNLERLKITPQDCKRFAPLVRSCELYLAPSHWAEIANWTSLESIFSDFRVREEPMEELLSAWPLRGAGQLYRKLVEALTQGVPVEYLCALSAPFDEDEWYLGERVLYYAPRAYRAGVPASYALSFVRVRQPDGTRIPATVVVNSWERNVPVEYIQAGLSSRLGFGDILQAWDDGIPVEYLPAVSGG